MCGSKSKALHLFSAERTRRQSQQHSTPAQTTVTEVHWGETPPAGALSSCKRMQVDARHDRDQGPSTESHERVEAQAAASRHTTCAQCYAWVGGCMGSVDAATKYQVAKWYYRIGIVFTTGLAWVLRDHAGERFALTASAFHPCQDAADPQTCGAQQVVMRVSWANCCFFALHTVLLLGLQNNDRRINLHGALWLWKTLLWGGCIVGFFFVPTNALLGYAQVARVGSCVFLVLALIRILDLVFKASAWITLEARTNSGVWLLMVAGTIVLFGLGLLLTGLCFRYFTHGGGCSLNLWFITWSLIAMAVMIVGLFLPARGTRSGRVQSEAGGRAADYAVRPESAGERWRSNDRDSAAYNVPSRQPSVLTSGMVFLFCSMLLTSALGSEPDDHGCKSSGWTDSGWMKICALLIQLTIALYTCWVASSPRPYPPRRCLVPMDRSSSLPYRADYFHLVFALASMFIGSMLASWQVSPSSGTFQIDHTWVSTWLKMVTKWVCEAIYIASVIAPVLVGGGSVVVRLDFLWYRVEVAGEEDTLLPGLREMVRTARRTTDSEGQAGQGGQGMGVGSTPGGRKELTQGVGAGPAAAQVDDAWRGDGRYDQRMARGQGYAQGGGGRGDQEQRAQFQRQAPDSADDYGVELPFPPLGHPPAPHTMYGNAARGSSYGGLGGVPQGGVGGVGGVGGAHQSGGGGLLPAGMQPAGAGGYPPTTHLPRHGEAVRGPTYPSIGGAPQGAGAGYPTGTQHQPYGDLGGLSQGSGGGGGYSSDVQPHGGSGYQPFTYGGMGGAVQGGGGGGYGSGAQPNLTFGAPGGWLQGGGGGFGAGQGPYPGQQMGEGPFSQASAPPAPGR